jgi:rhamnosyltransferase subunit B
VSRILVTTFGTAGDLNPFVALALGLMARGHGVEFAVEDNFRSTLIDTGFDKVHRLSGGIDPTSVASERQLYGSSLPFRSVQAMISRYIVPTLMERVEDLRIAAVGLDLIIAPPEQFAASIVSELTGIPWVSVRLSPVSVPSAHVNPHPWPVRLPDPLQQVVNVLQWRVGTAALRLMADRPINAIRARYGLPPRRNQLTTGNLSHDLAAIAVSPAFVPVQPDWPAQLGVTGFCFWDTPTAWTPSPELTSFLDGSRPVVTVSTGSISPQSGTVFDRFYNVSIEAVRRAGARALVVGAPAASLPDSLSDDVLALPFAPFSTIYPHCAAVIIGTTAQGLRAGVPALVVPWGFDQFFTAAQVVHIGTGRWLSRRRYTARRAATALGTLLQTDSMYCRRAGAVAARIAEEDGVANLCGEIDDLLEATGMPGGQSHARGRADPPQQWSAASWQHMIRCRPPNRVSPRTEAAGHPTLGP